MVQPPPSPSVVDGKVAVTVGWSRVVGAQKLSLMYSWTTLWTNRAKRETANSRQVTLNPTDTSYTVEDADGYSMYCFTLTATYSGDVQSSADQVCQDTPATKPSVPVDVQISQVMSTSLVVSWGIPLRPNGKITSFKVSYTAQDSVRVEYSQYLSQGGMWRLTELTPNTLYSIEVTAVNSEGEGPSSPSYRLTTAEQPTEPPQSSSLTVIIIVVVVVVVILVLIVLIIISVIVLCIMRNRHKQYAREETMFGLDMEMKERGKDGNHFETKTPEGLDSPVVELSEDVIETSAGAATLVYVNVEGTPTPQVVWSKDGDFLDEKNFIILSEGSLFIPLTRPQDGGTYTITAANSHGRSSVEVLLDVAVQIPPSPDPDHPPIGEDKFPEVVANLRANDENGFNEEYDTLDMDEWKLTTHASKAIVNYSKNRYINIIPYDHSRVVLELLGDLPGTDYINASWIDGYKQKRAYIACQGPLPNYIEDFWRMIWQYQIQTIVMVTNLMEGQKIKCHRYWPESGSTSFGMYEVTLKKEEKLAEYTVRDLVVNVPRSKGPLTLKQFHFTSWPDHGVPLYATGLLSFRNRVNKHQQSFAHIPIVVHCSAGVGRTGTYIAIDTMLKKKDDEGVVDVFDCVRKLRWQRRYMVQTVSQYVFVYNSLLEAVMCGETCVSVQNFRQRLAELSTKTTDNQTRCGDEFEKLQITSPLVEDFACEVAVGNSSKNRDSIYLPPDDSRVQLEEAEEEGSSDYVNASYLDGYSQQKAFIVAQVPLVKTQSDFWSMIWEQNSHVISLLTQPEENDKELSVQYWPSGDGETKQYGTVTVKLVSEDSVNSDYVARKLKIWRENKEEESRSITQFHYTNWPEGGCPGNAGSLIELINDLQRVQRKSGNHPITVQCSNGVGRSGALCALMTALERVKTEQIVDVFRAVKSLRIQRPGIVESAEQYKFVHEGLLQYLTSFEGYSNFA
jgi:protein tyrosine phosphatase